MQGIPEAPFEDFALESAGEGGLALALRYPAVGENSTDLILEFTEVRAFRSFWDGDGDGPWDDDPPRCSGTYECYIWPLLTVQPSRWLASGQLATSQAIADGLVEEPWRHYQVITLNRSLDVIARGAVRAHWGTESG